MVVEYTYKVAVFIAIMERNKRECLEGSRGGCIPEEKLISH